MKLATTTEDFQRFCETNIERVTNLVKAGFRYIDLNMYVENHNPEIFLDENWKENILKLKTHAESLGATFVQAHAPGVNPFRKDVDYTHVVDIVKRSIEVCGMLGIKNVVLHNGYDVSYTKEQFTEKNIAFFGEFLPLIEHYGVNLLCENTTKKNMPENYFPVTGNEMLDFIKAANHPLIHACWDTGHGNCEGKQYEQLKTLGKELYALHINDNSGRGDEHIIPYFGTLNMDDIMHGLIAAGFDGYFTFEAGCSLRPAKYWQGNRQEFPDDTRLAEPQFFMQEKVERLMYEIGEYILNQYGVFEE